MSADSDDAEFVFYGTTLQQEDVTSRRHEFQKKDVANAAGSKSLPVWKQVLPFNQPDAASIPVAPVALQRVLRKMQWPRDSS